GGGALAQRVGADLPRQRERSESAIVSRSSKGAKIRWKDWGRRLRMPSEHRSSEEAHLDSLFQAYYSACEPGPVSPNFMPELWQKIERAQSATFSFQRIAKGFVTAAAALSLILAVVGFLPARLNSPVYNVSYVDALAAHNDAVAHSSEVIDYVDLAHVDSPDDAEEL